MKEIKRENVIYTPYITLYGGLYFETNEGVFLLNLTIGKDFFSLYFQLKKYKKILIKQSLSKICIFTLKKKISLKKFKFLIPSTRNVFIIHKLNFIICDYEDKQFYKIKYQKYID